MTSNLMSRVEAAKYLDLQPQTLAVWASTKRYNLPYIKVGRSVKYSKTALDQFIQANSQELSDTQARIAGSR